MNHRSTNKHTHLNNYRSKFFSAFPPLPFVQVRSKTFLIVTTIIILLCCSVESSIAELLSPSPWLSLLLLSPSTTSVIAPSSLSRRFIPSAFVAPNVASVVRRNGTTATTTVTSSRALNVRRFWSREAVNLEPAPWRSLSSLARIRNRELTTVASFASVNGRIRRSCFPCRPLPPFSGGIVLADIVTRFATSRSEETSAQSNEEMEASLLRRSGRRRKRVKDEPDEEEPNIKEVKKESLESTTAASNDGETKTETTTPRKKKQSTPRKKELKAEEGGTSSSQPKKDTRTSKTEKPPTKTQKKTTVVKNKTTTRTKKPKIEPQSITDRDDLPKLWNGDEAMEKDGSYTFKIISWNVAGLRALLKNHPNALPSLATEHNADVICLQETKLQEIHVDDPKLKIGGVLLEQEGFDATYSCSKGKKGYSGTAVFVKRRQRLNRDVIKGTEEEEKENDDTNKTKRKTTKKKQMTMGSFFNASETTTTTKATAIEATGDVPSSDLTPLKVSTRFSSVHDTEGRLITVDFPLFSLTNLYVPNSGQKLERLDYRTKSWDVDLAMYIRTKEKEGRDGNGKRPQIWLGDLNVAHRKWDVYNDGAKHLAKQAGTTEEERKSFGRQLDGDVESYRECSYMDAFRHLHPEAKGHYTYWSQRAGNRDPNKGLRLDYFVCSEYLFEDNPNDQGSDRERKRVLVRDSYMIPELMGSDHCPVVLELEIRKP